MSVSRVLALGAEPGVVSGWHGAACPAAPCRVIPRQDGYAVTACFWSLLVTSMLRGLAASWTGMVRVSTPAA